MQNTILEALEITCLYDFDSPSELLLVLNIWLCKFENYFSDPENDIPAKHKN
jgi:hypothetical protein